ncbi:MAG: SsrA-binding protein [Syntrophomonadaceae bacterium]|nr:SsrA-binding protein [Bacillota bacterium]
MSANVATNKRAWYDYEILETYEAGIALRGAEVKSLRGGMVSLKDSFVRVDGDEAFIYNLYIAPYECDSECDEDPGRRRKLLLHKREIERIKGKTTERGLTVIPLKIYFKRGLAKAELALSRGKRQYDKRELLRRREAEREMGRAAKVKRG